MCQCLQSHSTANLQQLSSKTVTDVAAGVVIRETEVHTTRNLWGVPKFPGYYSRACLDANQQPSRAINASVDLSCVLVAWFQCNDILYRWTSALVLQSPLEGLKLAEEGTKAEKYNENVDVRCVKYDGGSVAYFANRGEHLHVCGQLTFNFVDSVND